MRRTHDVLGATDTRRRFADGATVALGSSIRKVRKASKAGRDCRSNTRGLLSELVQKLEGEIGSHRSMKCGLGCFVAVLKSSNQRELQEQGT
jgi:hypothetical protein